MNKLIECLKDEIIKLQGLVDEKIDWANYLLDELSKSFNDKNRLLRENKELKDDVKNLEIEKIKFEDMAKTIIFENDIIIKDKKGKKQ